MHTHDPLSVVIGQGGFTWAVWFADGVLVAITYCARE
jgi:hypothetical protein